MTMLKAVRPEPVEGPFASDQHGSTRSPRMEVFK